MEKKIIITGVTGLIGKALTNEFLSDYQIVGMSRNPEKYQALFPEAVTLTGWDGKSADNLLPELTGTYAIINLAGEPVAGKRWSPKQKQKIVYSRTQTVKAVFDAVRKAENKPFAVLQGSATGYYGISEQQIFTEQCPKGDGFLAETTEKWEMTAKAENISGIRMPILRTGVVLSRNGGALPKLLKPFDFYLGGTVGSGRQWISWVHIKDYTRAVRFLLENEQANGVYNITAPMPVTVKTMINTAGKVL
ncbi:MAG: TIGR01777 family oxidoreductase, partial [Bacteroidales bacterium]